MYANYLYNNYCSRFAHQLYINMLISFPCSLRQNILLVELKLPIFLLLFVLLPFLLPSRYLCYRIVGLIEELTRLMSMADEITLDDEEIKSVRVLYTDLVESLPCLCEVCPWIDVCLLLFHFVVSSMQ